MDFLFDITNLGYCDTGTQCRICKLNSPNSVKFEKAMKVQDGTSDKCIIIIGGQVSKYAAMLHQQVSPDFLAPILSQLPQEYTVYYISCVQCYNENPVSHEALIECAKACSSYVHAQIKQYKPQYVICFDSPAIASIYANRTDKGCNAYLWRGNCIPDSTVGAYVVPTLSLMAPSSGDESGVLWKLLCEDLKLVKYGRKHKNYTPDIITNDTILSNILEGDTIAFDYETTGLKPDNQGHSIYCVGLTVVGSNDAYAFRLNEGNIGKWKAILANPRIKKIAHNVKMEDKWSRVILNTPVNGWVWDTCLGAHCINPTKGNSGLKFQALVNFGVGDYAASVEKYIKAEGSNNKNKIYSADEQTILKYCALDSYYTAELYPIQVETLSSRTSAYDIGFTDGCQFLTQVQRAFSVMETTGIAIDTELMEKFKVDVADKKQEVLKKFEGTELYKTWHDTYGSATNIYSTKQAQHVLFNVLKLKPPKETDGGDYAVDEDALLDLRVDGIDHYIRVKKYDKVTGTYYNQFINELDENGILHCEMQLNTTRTYRTSCTNPNLQNISRNDKEQSRYIRSLFKSQYDDFVIIEADLKGCEVSGAACHTKDANLIAYVSDSKLDMHRDIGEILYKVDKGLISKDLRSITKKYTFGSFYGSFWQLTGPTIYKDIVNMSPKLTDGTLVLDYLNSVGLGTLDAFIANTQEADNYFWTQQFPGYTRWKKAIYARYLDDGYVDMFTGFRRYGPLSRNQVINTPIQGDSGHINLWLCCYVLGRIKQSGMPAKLFLQIHDSILGLVHKDYVTQYCQLYREGINELKKRWKWMICPFEVEYEVAPVGGSWFDKKELKV